MDSLAAPKGLIPSAIPLTIVFGPPCAGKTTYVDNNKAKDDLVIDFDDIVEKITGRRWPQKTDHIPEAMARRNRIIRSLSTRKEGRAWLILTAPSKVERHWWTTKLGAEAIIIDPGKLICIERAEERGTPWIIHPILRWYRGRQWKPPVERLTR